MNNATSILVARKICKAYNGVPALQSVDFSLQKGEVHALLGENGAGKSTLIKILSGIVSYDSGEIEFDGEQFKPRNPFHASQSGIATVHQEFSSSPYLPVYQNIWLGHEPKGPLGTLNFTRLRELAAELCNKYDIHLNLDAWVGELPLAEQQIVEILKALSWQPKVLILDEPTSALTVEYTKWLLNVMRQLVQQGTGIIFISHRLKEIVDVTDRITVLKDGLLVGITDDKDYSEQKIIQMMVGRELQNIFPPKQAIEGEQEREPVLSVSGLTSGRFLREIDFNLKRGEILGIYGLEGQGQHELMMAMYGAFPIDKGQISLSGQEVKIRNPRMAIKNGVALIPVDRRTEGLVMPLSIRENLSLPTLRKRTCGGVINLHKENEDTQRMVDEFTIKAPHKNVPVQSLSGGNQQKVVMGKFMLANPSVLLYDDPTRGVDVETRRELYYKIRKLAAEGTAILFRSTDLMELIGLCDTVLVMHEGGIIARYTGAEITETNIVGAAVGFVEEGGAT
jgi:ribose transport system ATP-binding protein